MKWFRKRRGIVSVVVGGALLAAGLGAAAAPARWHGLGILFGPRNGITHWLENVVAGSAMESALYRGMQLPGGNILFRRSPRETRPALTELLQHEQHDQHDKKSAALDSLYSLRALEDEQALDFDAAERDWKTWADKADDKAAANLDLADFYERRLKPQEELAALDVVGRAAASEQERWTASESQRSWQAWERTQRVVEQYALPRALAAREYAAWEQRYPQEKAVYTREFAFLLEGKDFAAAAQLLARYSMAFAGDRVFPVQAEAELAAKRGTAKDGLAVYDRSFEPLWPAELVTGYYVLLAKSQQVRSFSDELRAKLAANPDDLKDAARLFYIYQQQGQLDSAKAVLADYRNRKDAHGAQWSDKELYTLGRLLEAVQDFPEAARYYYALASEHATNQAATNQESSEAEQKGLAGLTRILLTAPEQPLRPGAGNLALYKSIATMDRGPGYLNGILSLLLNSASPRSEFAQQSQLAVPYFHRAQAAELLAAIDKRFPNAAERAPLHAALLQAYAAYGENDAVLREGNAYLAHFPDATGRLEVALEVADAYARTNQAEKEFALYQTLLKEMAARADGVPLGLPGPAYSKRISAEQSPAAQTSDGEAATSSTRENAGPMGSVRSPQYAQVLDRYLSRLVALERLPDALAVLRGELDRNPQDPGLYQRLAEFLEQNSLDARQEEVYQRAMQQFKDTSWYAKLARFYLRQKRNADYTALSHKVTQIFTGTELEQYLRQAPAPDRRLALEVNRYAHERFPHDLNFVQNLLSEYARNHQQVEAEKLLWEHWAESPALRDQLFELLSRTGKLEAQLEILKQQTPQIAKADWSSLAQQNPAAERLWMEACLWQSHFEQGAGAADALAAEYPAEETLGRQASALYRSLAYFHPEDTEKAVAIEKRLLNARPGDMETLARIGDIYADQGRFAEAAPYWMRMAEVHPGIEDGLLQSATVFWDYFDFPSALAQLHKARERSGQPALFGYQVGAIAESQGNPALAVKEYVASALDEKPSVEGRERLLTLALRQDLRATVEDATAGLLGNASPSAAAIQLRVSVLDAEHRKPDLEQELKHAAAQTESFDVLDALAEAARNQSLPVVEEIVLRRQIALTADPVRNLQLRYQLVDFYQRRTPAAAAAEVDAIYREHDKVLGVVRSTVDYDWAHDRKPKAVDVLLQSAQSAYPQLRQQLQSEAARKLTELGEYSRSKALLELLLSQQPLDAGYQAAMAENFARAGDQSGLEAFYHAELASVQGAALERVEKQRRVAELRRGVIAAATVLNNSGEALDQYVELINAYPDDAGLAQEAALYAVAHGLRDKLFGFYQKTVEASPRDPRWSLVLARLDTAAEDYPAAVTAYGKAIALRPERKDLYQARADLEQRIARLDDAVNDYQKLYSLTYRDPQWMEKVAETRARQGRSADAVKALEVGWLEGRPAKAANSFEVATRLEHWGLLEEARKFAERGVQQAAADLLVDAESQRGAVTYARILARLRQVDATYSRLVEARQQAGKITLAAVVQQVAKAGPGAVTDEKWRKQRQAERSKAAGQGFAQAIEAMAQVVGDYYTPEEKAQFSAWLQAKRTGADTAELRAVYLPAAQAAGLADVEADLRWELVEKSALTRNAELHPWMQLQQQRLQMESAGASLERLAASVPAKQRATLWQRAVEVYRKAGDSVAELRATTRLTDSVALKGQALMRYYQILLAQRPQELVRQSAADSAAQFVVERGSAQQALAAVVARSAGLPPVWRAAYTGLVGLYLREHGPAVREAFSNALGGDRTIGERIAHPADRSQELAGAVWFYYGSRYGEYLDEEKDARAEGYLEAELEHTPGSAPAYARLADYSTTAGRSDYALMDYQTSLDLKDDQPAVLDSIATIEWKQGRQAQAVTAWQQSMKRLAAEIDGKPVPESFWGDFSRVIGNVHAQGQYGAVQQQVDAMLRRYLARNGSYRVGSLLEAGYHANGDSAQWLLQMTAAASAPGEVLKSLQRSLWIQKGQRSLILARIVELERRRAAANPGATETDLALEESRWVDQLLAEKKFAEARAVLEEVPRQKRNTAPWLPVELRMAEADGRLEQTVQQWQKLRSDTPSSSDLRNAVSVLSEKGKRTVLRFVYQRALDARELTAPNFLGLAAIHLEDGDTAGAMELLQRMTLVSDSVYADRNSAAALLEARQKYAEAIQFLQPLAEASPWEAEYKVRLAAATLAVTPQLPQALAVATAVVADPKAKYRERVAAARVLKGHGAAEIDSGELKLLTEARCPAENAVKPYFVQARAAAAACAASDKTREQLLRDALAIAPSNALVRLQYVWAAFAVGQNSRALVAAEPFLERGPRYGQQYSPRDNGSDQEEAFDAGSVDAGGTEEKPQRGAVSIFALKPEDAERLYLLAIRAREQQHETWEALRLVQQALSGMKNPQRRQALQAQQTRLNLELARVQENQARAPKIHAELEQDRVVRARWIAGTPFVPQAIAEGEDSE